MSSRTEKPLLSVAQLADILKGCFDNPMFSDIGVYGEVYSVKLGKYSYIEIGDSGKKENNSPLLKCAFFSYYGDDLPLSDVRIGDVISIRGKLSYYAHGSSLTLWGKTLEILSSQNGKNLLEKKKILERLDKLGYLDESRKRPIPSYCRKAAIITAANGAAYQDILKTLHQRFPLDTVLYPAIVQGENAAKSMVSAMKKAVTSDADVIILGRGGGSKTDLSCFDDEQLALAIATSPIPVITCIGHTIDTAIADRVSDAHAITPTEGASLINQRMDDVLDDLDAIKGDLYTAYTDILHDKAMDLMELRKKLELLSPSKKVELLTKQNMRLSNSLLSNYLSLLRTKMSETNQLSENLKERFSNLLSTHALRKEKLASLLAAYDPSSIAKKGYASITSEGKIIRSSKDLSVDQEITISFADGRKKAKIIGD